MLQLHDLIIFEISMSSLHLNIKISFIVMVGIASFFVNAPNGLAISAAILLIGMPLLAIAITRFIRDDIERTLNTEALQLVDAKTLGKERWLESIKASLEAFYQCAFEIRISKAIGAKTFSVGNKKRGLIVVGDLVIAHLPREAIGAVIATELGQIISGYRTEQAATRAAATLMSGLLRRVMPQHQAAMIGFFVSSLPLWFARRAAKRQYLHADRIAAGKYGRMQVAKSLYQMGLIQDDKASDNKDLIAECLTGRLFAPTLHERVRHLVCREIIPVSPAKVLKQVSSAIVESCYWARANKAGGFDADEVVLFDGTKRFRLKNVALERVFNEGEYVKVETNGIGALLYQNNDAAANIALRRFNDDRNKMANSDQFINKKFALMTQVAMALVIAAGLWAIGLCGQIAFAVLEHPGDAFGAALSLLEPQGKAHLVNWGLLSLHDVFLHAFPLIATYLTAGTVVEAVTGCKFERTVSKKLAFELFAQPFKVSATMGAGRP